MVVKNGYSIWLYKEINYVIINYTSVTLEKKGECMKKLKVIALLSLVVITSIMMVGCKNNDKLSSATETQIRQDYLDQLIKPIDATITFDDVVIEKEYGKYDGYIVVRFVNVISYPGGIVPIEIGGIQIDYNFASRIVVWKDGDICTIISAQESNILTQASLQAIARIDNTLI